MGLLNVEGFFDGLLSFLDHATAEVRNEEVKGAGRWQARQLIPPSQLQGFIRPASRAILVCGSSPAELIDTLER